MAGARRYRAFISYSHARDQPLAAALARALERFARPWWKLRAMRVFVDQHSLGANAALWKTIERALGASEWLLLLASPAAAASPWVCQEVAWWLAHRSPERILIALTDGGIVWQGQAFDAARSDALPEPLREAFAQEPTWVDFTQAARWRHLSPRDADFRAAFLRIGAPLHGLASPDDLWNEHAWRWRQMIGAVAVAAGVLALTTWGVWRVDRIAAERDEHLASVQLGARALLLQPQDPALAARVALAGVLRRPSGVAAAALRSALAGLAGDALPQRRLDVPGAVDLAYAPDARRLAVLTGDGQVLEIDLTSGARRTLPVASIKGRAHALAWSADGTLAVAAADGLWLWRGDAAAQHLALPGAQRLAFSTDGTRLALAEAKGGWRVLSAADGRTLGQGRADAAIDALAFSHDGTQLATGGERVTLWDWVAARPLAHWPAPGGTAALDFNHDGETTVAKWMLAIAPRAAPVQVVDPAEPSRAIALDRAARAAGFVASGRCLALASDDAAVDVVSGFGFVRLFGLAGDTGTVRAMALGATEHFAVLRDTGRVALYVQPLCGDAEALCRFADARLAEPMSAAERLRHLPPPAPAPVSQPPGPACSALAARVLPDWR